MCRLKSVHYSFIGTPPSTTIFILTFPTLICPDMIQKRRRSTLKLRSLRCSSAELHLRLGCLCFHSTKSSIIGKPTASKSASLVKTKLMFRSGQITGNKQRSSEIGPSPSPVLASWILSSLIISSARLTVRPCSHFFHILLTRFPLIRLHFFTSRGPGAPLAR
jgi:hypothetical protein